jgi:uncharacterized protein (TIGR02996 family)
MLSTYADAFLDAILESPDDDAPRLIYADWLDESEDEGDPPRAEFIRLQIDLARRPADDPRRAQLAARERQLLAAHGARWARPVAALTRDYEFRRGFVERVRLEAATLLRHAPALFAVAPLRHLDLVLTHGDASKVAGCPHLERFTTLHLASPGGPPEELVELLASPHLTNLRALRLRYLPPAALQGLAASVHLERLEVLDLGASSLGAGGMQAALSARLPALRHLLLNTSNLGDPGVRWLVHSPLAAGLTALDLAINHVGPAGAEALAAASHLGGLRTLWLGFNLLGDDGAEALAGSPYLRLRRLYLGSNRLGAAAVLALCRAPALAELTHLDLDYNDLPTSALLALAESPHLGRLEALYLRCGRGLTVRARDRLKRRFGERVCRF